MAVATGVESRATWAKASSWATVASDPTTDAWHGVNTVGVKPTRELAENDEIGYTALRRAAAAGIEAAGGPIERNLHYEGDDLLLALAMGTAGTATQVGTTTAYTNTYTMNRSLEGLFASFWFDVGGVETWELDTAKVVSVTISASADDPFVTVTYELIGHDFSDLADAITWASVTESSNERENYALFGHLTALLNDSSGGALTAGVDDIYISGFEVTIERNVEEFRTTRRWPNVDEPIINDFAAVSGSLTLETFDTDNDQHVQDVLSKTVKKMALQFSNGDAGGGNPYELFFNVPAMKWDGEVPDPIPGPGRHTWELAWVAEDISSAPTGMSDTEPYFATQNQISTAPI